MVLCGAAALGSYSRGALLGISAMVLFLWVKSPKKMVVGILLATLLPIGMMWMPDKWSQRMETINTYKEDSSAMGRINAWWMAYNMAVDRPLVGGGYEIYNGISFARYAPVPTDVHAAHSIYFQALGEHGFVGLGLYLAMALMLWRKGSWIARQTAKRADLKWAANIATMLQVSMIGFATGGAFLSLLYYDVPYYLAAVMVSLGCLVERELKQGADTAVAVSSTTAAAARWTANARSVYHDGK
jgi:probable O-glycosylation ligase (exosortase A-associated)